MSEAVLKHFEIATSQCDCVRRMSSQAIATLQSAVLSGAYVVQRSSIAYLRRYWRWRALAAVQPPASLERAIERRQFGGPRGESELILPPFF